MARYELSDGKSEKFWEIVVKGTSFTTTYGRLGTSGQSKTKDFADKAAAKAAAEKLTAQKVKKGYAKKGAAKTATAKKATAKKPATAKKATAKKTTAKKATAKKATAKKPAKKSAATKKTARGGYRFELTSGSSNKFWEIEITDAVVTTRYGRIGADGTATEKTYGSPAEAQKKHDKLIAEKMAKGYELAGGELPKSMTAKAAVNPKMEAAIAANPDDESAWAVYADWLLGQGDPRGELAAVQMALASASGARKTKLSKTEKKLFEDYGEHFVAKLVADHQARHLTRKPKGKKNQWQTTYWQQGELRTSWKAGFITAVRLATHYDDTIALDALLEPIVSHPSGRLLAELEVGGPHYDWDDNSFVGLVKLLASAKRPALRRLFLADFNGEQCELSWSSAGKLGALWKAAPSLEDVTIHVGSFELGTINLPKLKTLRVQTGGLNKKNFKSIASAKCPKLEKLDIWFGSSSYGADVTAKLVKPFLSSATIAKVTDLGLMNSEIVDEVCKFLPKSAVAKKLVRLDLSMGIMTDEGAEALAANPKAFPKLVELDVSDNYLTAAGIKALKPLAKTIHSKGQDTPDDWGDGELHRYVDVGE